MKNILLLVLLCFCTILVTNAQNNASLKGTIIDSVTRSPLGFSTVAVVNAKDTSLVSYTVTKEDGTFQLSRLPTTRSLKLIVSYVGYESYRQILDLKPGLLDLGTLKLIGRSLGEIIITGERSPVVMKKDTIEFNAEAFKTRPNALVEELLRLLPGVQVNENGEVLVNGKGTSRILIDGKEFFGTNQLIALRNLDAEMIDKIQVYLDRENDPDHKVNEINLQNVINLKLKSAVKKSTIGKFMGGIGSRERYEASGIMSSFRDTLQFSVMGAANNLNSTGFSQNDLQSMGGFNRSGSDQVDYGNFGGRQSGGFVNVKSGGININNDYGKKLKLNIAYFYGNTINNNETKNLNEQSLPNTVITSLRTDQAKTNATTHSLGGLVEWNPDTTESIRYRPALTFSPQRYRYSSFLKQYNTQIPSLSETDGHNRSSTSSDAFSHNFTYYKRFKKGRSLTINNLLDLNSGSTEKYNYNRLTSFSSELESSLFDRYIANASKTKWTGLSILYNLPLSKKLTVELFSNSRYYYWAEPLFTYDKDNISGNYDQFLPEQSNDFERTGFFQNLKPLLNYQINSSLRVRAALDLEIQDVNNKFNTLAPDIRQRFTVLFPSLAIDYNGFSMSYGEWVDIPSIYNMQPISREISAQYTFIGNPELVASRQRNLRANYYKYVTSRMLSISGFASSMFSDNNFVQKAIIDEKGFTTATVVNKDGGQWISGGGSIGKQFKKSQQWQIGMRTGLSGNYSSRIVFLNNDEARQRFRSFGVTQDFNLNYKSLAMINFYYMYQRSLVDYMNQDFNTVLNYSHSLGSSGSFRLPKRIVIDAKYSFMYNPQIAQGFPRSSHIVNLALSLLTHQKDRGQLKLSVYDLLNQNISVNRYGNLNALITNEQLILKRYVMLNYQYRFNILKTKN
nr:TonB-dependent receptor [Pedobacter panaciterrae]